MRTRVWKNTNPPAHIGLLTDMDIFATEGQRVYVDGKDYRIAEISFTMIVSGENISAEKQIFLEGVEEDATTADIAIKEN